MCSTCLPVLVHVWFAMQTHMPLVAVKEHILSFIKIGVLPFWLLTQGSALPPAYLEAKINATTAICSYPPLNSFTLFLYAISLVCVFLYYWQWYTNFCTEMHCIQSLSRECESNVAEQYVLLHSTLSQCGDCQWPADYPKCRPKKHTSKSSHKHQCWHTRNTVICNVRNLWLCYLGGVFAIEASPK